MVVSEPPFSDKTEPLDLDHSAIKLLAKAYDIEVSNSQTAMMLIPNGEKALSTYTWMNEIFKLIGDVQPNSDEIHLEAMGKYSCLKFYTVLEKYHGLHPPL